MATIFRRLTHIEARKAGPNLIYGSINKPSRQGLKNAQRRPILRLIAPVTSPTPDTMARQATI